MPGSGIYNMITSDEPLKTQQEHFKTTTPNDTLFKETQNNLSALTSMKSKEDFDNLKKVKGFIREVNAIEFSKNILENERTGSVFELMIRLGLLIKLLYDQHKNDKDPPTGTPPSASAPVTPSVKALPVPSDKNRPQIANGDASEGKSSFLGSTMYKSFVESFEELQKGKTYSDLPFPLNHLRLNPDSKKEIDDFGQRLHDDFEREKTAIKNTINMLHVNMPHIDTKQAIEAAAALYLISKTVGNSALKFVFPAFSLMPMNQFDQFDLNAKNGKTTNPLATVAYFPENSANYPNANAPHANADQGFTLSNAVFLTSTSPTGQNYSAKGASPIILPGFPREARAQNNFFVPKMNPITQESGIYPAPYGNHFVSYEKVADTRPEDVRLMNATLYSGASRPVESETYIGNINIYDAKTDDTFEFAQQVEAVITSALNRTSNIFNPNIAI
ncbi:hypothetical protein FAI40_04570 [Acetobacteraceae bacterium]|nr:hypothetical protein FAI40_04570 [Acetobacteraceae bacterium]